MYGNRLLADCPNQLAPCEVGCCLPLGPHFLLLFYNSATKSLITPAASIAEGVKHQSSIWCLSVCLSPVISNTKTADAMQYQCMFQPFCSRAVTLVTFHIRRRQVKCIVATAVCVMSLPCHVPTLLHGPRCNFGEY